jgi:hypothetical protein
MTSWVNESQIVILMNGTVYVSQLSTRTCSGQSSEPDLYSVSFILVNYKFCSALIFLVLLPIPPDS